MPRKKSTENADLRKAMSHCSELIDSYNRREDRSPLLSSMLERLDAELKERILQSFMNQGLGGKNLRSGNPNKGGTNHGN